MANVNRIIIWRGNFEFQMLQAVSNVAPRSVYVCGNTTTTSGLTVSKVKFNSVFLSPPVHFAQWAHMRRFLSVRLSVCPDWTKNQTG